jgi:hypothetical protein
LGGAAQAQGQYFNTREAKMKTSDVRSTAGSGCSAGRGVWGQFGANASRNECNQLMIEIAKIKETQVSNFQNLQRDIRAAMSADTANVIPVLRNVFVHHTQNKKVWKV